MSVQAWEGRGLPPQQASSVTAVSEAFPLKGHPQSFRWILGGSVDCGCHKLWDRKEYTEETRETEEKVGGKQSYS